MTILLMYTPTRRTGIPILEDNGFVTLLTAIDGGQ